MAMELSHMLRLDTEPAPCPKKVIVFNADMAAHYVDLIKMGSHGAMVGALAIVVLCTCATQTCLGPTLVQRCVHASPIAYV